MILFDDYNSVDDLNDFGIIMYAMTMTYEDKQTCCPPVPGESKGLMELRRRARRK